MPIRAPKLNVSKSSPKSFSKIVKNEFPEKKLFIDRATGTLKCGWTPVAIVAAPSSSEISFKWNNGGIDKSGLNKAVIKDACDFATDGSANVEWSS